MGWRGTAVLAVCVVSAAAFLWFEGSARQEQASRALTFDAREAPEPTLPVRRLLDFLPTEVIAVQLEQGGLRRAAQWNGNAWEGAAEAGAVTDFLHNLSQLGVLAEIPSEQADLQDYGLQPPQSVLRLRLRNRTAPLILEIGDRNPATTGAYVRVGESGPVLLAGALVTWEFEKAFKALGAAQGG